MQGRKQERPGHHCDQGFRNQGDTAELSSFSLSLGAGFLGRRIAASLVGPEGQPPSMRKVETGAIIDAVDAKKATVTWVGHSTLLVTLNGVTFLTDPTWSATASPLALGPSRFVGPPLSLEDLPHIDFVVVSHNHYDHMDLKTLKTLESRGARIFVPLANAYLLEGLGAERVTEMDWWDQIDLEGVRLHCVPAKHWSRRGLFDRNRSLWSGWVVESKGRRFYFAGDTGSFDGFRLIRDRIGAPDLAAIPIGAYEPKELMSASHLNPEEAVDALEELDAVQSVAVHFGTFDLSDEPIDDPPRRFRAASQQAGRGAQRDWVLDIGETRSW